MTTPNTAALIRNVRLRIAYLQEAYADMRPHSDTGKDITLMAELADALTAEQARADAAEGKDLRILLQLALDEMLNVIEAVNHTHETQRWPVKYGTPYGAINGMITVRETILAQCAAWGVPVSPLRRPAERASDLAASRARPVRVVTDEELEMALDVFWAAPAPSGHEEHLARMRYAFKVAGVAVEDPNA